MGHNVSRDSRRDGGRYPMQDRVLPLSPSYREAIHFALLQQIPWSLLCLLMLDGGVAARLCGIALIAYWSYALAMMALRPRAPDRKDIMFLRWGFFPLFGVTVILARFL